MLEVTEASCLRVAVVTATQGRVDNALALAMDVVAWTVLRQRSGVVRIWER